MKTKYVSELKAGDELIEEQFAVKVLRKDGITRDGKPYFDLELSDKTGSIRGKVWSDYISFCKNFEEGDVVAIDAKVKSGRDGSPELTITRAEKVSKFELSDYAVRSAFDLDQMKEELSENINKIKNPDLKKLVNLIFTADFTEAFVHAPAAFTVHHDYENGLLEHTLEMLRLIPAIKASYPKLNEDLLITGTLLHDVGKIYEFEQKTSITITTEGKLLGHIFIGAEYIKNKMPTDIPKNLQDEILHMVLSHHGELEYGSPVKPKTTEAVALNALDLVSSRLNMAYYTIHNSGEQSLFSKYHRQLGVELYRSPYRDELLNEDIPF